MELTMLKGKIHRATVTQAELDYVGSITIDTDLLNASGIREYEQVQIVNINNGARFSTYTIAGESGSGVICLNGAAARHVQVKDKIIIMCYAQLNENEVDTHKPLVVFVDNNNKISHIKTMKNIGFISRSRLTVFRSNYSRLYRTIFVFTIYK